MQLGEFKIEGKDWVQGNSDGTEKRIPRSLLPDGSFMQPFAEYKAVLLRDYPQDGFSAGDEVTVAETPGAHLYLNNDEETFDYDAKPTVDFDIVQPVEILKEGVDPDSLEIKIRTGVDLIQEMIDADPPPEIDFDEAKTRFFLDDRETSTDTGSLAIYDISLYGKPFEKEDLLNLIKRKEIPGTVIDGPFALELLKIAMDSYMQNRAGASDQQRNLLAAKIYDLFEPLNLL